MRSSRPELPQLRKRPNKPHHFGFGPIADLHVATNSLPSAILDLAVSVHPRRAVAAAKPFLQLALGTPLSASAQLRVCSGGVAIAPLKWNRKRDQGRDFAE